MRPSWLGAVREGRESRDPRLAVAQHDPDLDVDVRLEACRSIDMLRLQRRLALRVGRRRRILPIELLHVEAPLARRAEEIAVSLALALRLDVAGLPRIEKGNELVGLAGLVIADEARHHDLDLGAAGPRLARRGLGGRRFCEPPPPRGGRLPRPGL